MLMKPKGRIGSIRKRIINVGTAARGQTQRRSVGGAVSHNTLMK